MTLSKLFTVVSIDRSVVERKIWYEKRAIMLYSWECNCTRRIVGENPTHHEVLFNTSSQLQELHSFLFTYAQQTRQKLIKTEAHLSINFSIKTTLVLREIREPMFSDHSTFLLRQHCSIPATSTRKHAPSHITRGRPKMDFTFLAVK